MTYPRRRRQAPAPPGVEHELALLLCQTRRVRAERRDSIQELARRVDFDTLAAALYSNGLLAICGSRLKQICGLSLPMTFVEAVDIAEERLRARTALFEAITVRLLTSLESSGMPVLPLKGALLARRIHGETPVRPSIDVDILVSRANVAAARQVIESHGYHNGDEILYVGGLPNLHYSYVALDGLLPPVELHWRIHWYETSFSEEMLARSYLDGQGIRRAMLADELAALLLFYQRDSFTGLKLAADIAAWWDTYGDQLPRKSLTPLLSSHPELHDALLASGRMVERLVSVPVTTLLSGSIRQRRRADWAVRMADWTLNETNRPRSRAPDPKLVANIALIDWLLTPQGRHQAYLQRYIFQPPLMFARDHGLPEKPRIRDHVRRFGHGWARIAKATIQLCSVLWQIRRGRYLHPLPVSASQRTPLPAAEDGRKNGVEPSVVEPCDLVQGTREFPMPNTARA